MKSAPFVVFLKVAAVFDLGIGSGDFSGMVPSREREMGMRSTVLRPMTALGQTRKSAPASATSDLPPTTDITSQSGHFREVPKCDIVRVHSITSSAVVSSDGGMVRPSVFAVLRLTTNSNFAGCTTGRSAGFSPLRIRPT